VAGQFAEARVVVLPVEVLEGLAHGLVYTGPPVHGHVLVQGVLDESVREAVAPRSPRQVGDHCRTLRLLKEIDQVVLVHTGRLREQVEVEVPADHRRRREHLGGVVPEARQAGPDDRPHTVGKSKLPFGVGSGPTSGVVLVDRSRLGQVAQHLGHEERVAVGLAVDLMRKSHPGDVEPVSGGLLHEGDDPGVVEPLQVQ
jgi:hypothetical protein